ncbi:PRC-barrel domain-containing protein [Prosthecobacter sp.]|uniref:PRC-barrel domain-containing protein n=1 Tax=Prosthecobacter sp. TaxID=1965333 RepID=UPI0024889543|nr:PRC-barrel domain-containing protein [Prosthecobacter sp.]MDI1312075.1 PRC-barrel domain-containing protein [Prosthecobacter sp.]
MLVSATSLKGYKLNGLDGEMGKAREFYFDDRFWTVRYLVADTGGWLTGRQVLIAPHALVGVTGEDEQIKVNLTQKQIEESPSLDSDKPVSRQFEEDYYGYHGWPTYWNGDEMWGRFPGIMRDRDQWNSSVSGKWAWDPHLRSTHEITGYDIEAKDGEFGHVEDFIIDDETWAIRYVVVTTRHWLPGKRFLISPMWIEHVNWSDSNLAVNLSREDIKSSPEYTQESLLTRLYEIGLHEHYNRPGYWVGKL